LLSDLLGPHVNGPSYGRTCFNRFAVTGELISCVRRVVKKRMAFRAIFFA
jgi:hypothetical protein